MPFCDKKNPDSNMFTNITSFVVSDAKRMEYMERRYGGFLAGIFDDMDATYASNSEMEPLEFYNWYIGNNIDIVNAREYLEEECDNFRVKLEMTELILTVEIFNGKIPSLKEKFLSWINNKVFRLSYFLFKKRRYAFAQRVCGLAYRFNKFVLPR